MNTPMSWSEILESYEGQWVELIEYDWDWKSPFPTWAVVRNHSMDRTELNLLIKKSEPVADSITLYLGAVGSVVDRSDSATVC